jgi:hypothetical protein
MAVTTTNSNNAIVKFRKQFWWEYRRGNLFAPYMGDGPTKIIQTTYELKDGGDQINMPFVGAMRGPGVGTGPLTGNEEKLDTYGMRVWIDWARNAILLNKAQLRKSTIDQLGTVRPLLTEWAQTLIRDEIILGLHAIPSESPPANFNAEAFSGQRVNGTLYSVASAAQKNAWSDANSDRVLYGLARSNLVAGNHAASLANVSTATGKASAALILLLKRMARRGNPVIRPFKQDEADGREYYVVFAGSNAFRDLAADSTIVQANTNARPREGGGMDNNPLFQDGDLLYRGVIIREIPEIDDLCTITGAGNTGIDVAPIFLCGQAAVSLPYGQMPAPTERKEDDYGFLKGRGVEMVYGVAKTFKKDTSGNLKQWGVATAYVASVADA